MKIVFPLLCIPSCYPHYLIIILGINSNTESKRSYRNISHTVFYFMYFQDLSHLFPITSESFTGYFNVRKNTFEEHPLFSTSDFQQKGERKYQLLIYFRLSPFIGFFLAFIKSMYTYCTFDYFFLYVVHIFFKFSTNQTFPHYVLIQKIKLKILKN